MVERQVMETWAPQLSKDKRRKQYEYDDKDPKEESVLHDRAWGFCDPKCFSQKEDIIAMDLQEVPFFSKSISGENLKVNLWILSEEECRNRTWTHSKAKFRAMVDR